MPLVRNVFFDSTTNIDHNVPAGKHFVECELLAADGDRGLPFKIYAVFST